MSLSGTSMRTNDTVISGNLHVNLNPPHISFHDGNETRSLNDLTTNELKSLLVDLGLIEIDQHWSLREFTLIVSGQFPKQAIIRAGLIPHALLPVSNGNTSEKLLAS